MIGEEANWFVFMKPPKLGFHDNIPFPCLSNNNPKEAYNMVFEKVREILCQQLDVEEEQVSMESAIIEDLNADSLDLVDLVMSLEDEFDIEIPDEDVEKIKTVGDLVGYIEKNK